MATPSAHEIVNGSHERTDGIHGAPLNTTALDLTALMTTIANGRDSMPAFGHALQPEDVHDVAAYVLEQLGE